jgi:hypothetical protein
MSKRILCSLGFHNFYFGFYQRSAINPELEKYANKDAAISARMCMDCNHQELSKTALNTELWKSIGNKRKFFSLKYIQRHVKKNNI